MIALAGMAAGLLSNASYAADDEAHWSYEGDTGPEHWAKLAEANAACAGSEQSPIDLTKPFEAEVEEIEVEWSAFAPVVLNNGHTIQANAAEGQTTRFGDATYELLQVHWHHQSEHTIDGEHAPLEAHFVHKDPDTGALLVLGVMMVQGDANQNLQTIWDVAPSEEGEATAEAETDWTEILPDDDGVYRYAGSLTTPPCTEIVNWVVFAEPIEVSQEQIDAFATLYPKNNRPLQDLGRRFVLLSD